MNSLEQRIEKQVQFWSLLGPCLFLVSVSVLVFKLTLHWYFPLSILMGIPLCVKWKVKGMAIALSLLFAVTIYIYPTLNLDERYWHVGMALALAFSFIILTLSLEEVEGVLTKLQIESKSRLENFLKLDSTTKLAEEAWTEERDSLTIQVSTLTQELSIALQDKEVFYKLAQLAKDELIQIRDQQEILLQDLAYKKHQISQVNEKLEETELTLQTMVDTQSSQVSTALLQEFDIVKLSEAKLKSELITIQSNYEKILEELNEYKNVQSHTNHQYELNKLIEEKKLWLNVEAELRKQLNEMQHYHLLWEEAQTKLQLTKNNLLNSEKQLQLLNKDLEAAKHVESSLQFQLSNLQKNLKEMQTQDLELVQQNTHLKNDLEVSTQQIQQLEHQLEETLQLKKELHHDKTTLEDLAADYLEKVTVTQSEQKQLQHNYEQLKVRLKEEENEKEFLTQKLALKELSHDKIAQDYKEVCQTLKHYELQFNELSNQVAANVQQEKSFRNDLEKLNALIESQKSEKEVLSAQCERYKNSENTYLQQLDKLNLELKENISIQKELQEQLSQKQSQILDLEVLLEKNTQDKLELKNSAISSQELLTEYENEIERLSQKLHILQEQAREKTVKVNEMTLSVEALKNEKEEFLSTKQQFSQKLDETKLENQLLLEALTHSENKEKEVVRSYEELQLQLTENKNFLTSFKEEIHLLKSHNVDLQKQLNLNCEALNQAKKELIHFNEKYLESQKLIENLKIETQKIELLETEKSNYAHAIQILHEKCETAQKLNTDIDNLERSYRGLQAMHKQLKEQFHEKSRVLDQTRQELFIAHENSLALQKTLEEQETFSLSDSERLLQLAYEDLINEYEEMQKNYEQEREQLQTLITHLTKI